MPPKMKGYNRDSARPGSITPTAARITAARAIASQLLPLIREADVAGLGMLSYLLGMARIEAEHIIRNSEDRSLT